MGFDKDSDQPIVNPRKKTTQFNIWMAISIVIFLLIMGLVVYRLRQNSTPAVQDLQENVAPPDHGR